MPRLPGDHFLLDISGTAVRLFHCRRWSSHGPRLLAQTALDGDMSGVLVQSAAQSAQAYEVLHQVLADMLRQHSRPRWAIDVTIDTRLVRLWQVTPVAGTRRRSDLEAAAAWRYRNLYGEQKPGWRISADWQTGRPFIAAALPESLLSAITLAAREHQLVLTSVIPHFIRLWNQWRSRLRQDWFGVVDGDSGVLHVGATGLHGLMSVRSAPLPPPMPGLAAAASKISAEWISSLLAREALLLDYAEPARIQLCADDLSVLDPTDRCRIIGPASLCPATVGALPGQPAGMLAGGA